MVSASTSRSEMALSLSLFSSSVQSPMNVGPPGAVGTLDFDLGGWYSSPIHRGGPQRSILVALIAALRRRSCSHRRSPLFSMVRLYSNSSVWFRTTSIIGWSCSSSSSTHPHGPCTPIDSGWGCTTSIESFLRLRMHRSWKLNTTSLGHPLALLPLAEVQTLPQFYRTATVLENSMDLQAYLDKLTSGNWHITDLKASIDSFGITNQVLPSYRRITYR